MSFIQKWNPPDDIVNDGMVTERRAPVSLNLENTNISPLIKQKITENFKDVLSFLDLMIMDLIFSEDGILMVGYTITLSLIKMIQRKVFLN